MNSPMTEEIKQVIAKHLDPLRKKERELSKELEQVRKQITEAENQLALLGTPVKKRGSAQGEGTKSTADEGQVLEAMTLVVQKKNGITTEALYAEIKKEISRRGHALTGLKQRVSKLLEDTRFEVKGDKISLVKAPAQAS